MSSRTLIGASVAIAVIAATAAISSPANAHDSRTSGQGSGWGAMGPGMMGQGMMGGGYGPGRGYGPGYTRGPDGSNRSVGPPPGYRGQRLCWKETDGRGDGHYEPCQE